MEPQLPDRETEVGQSRGNRGPQRAIAFPKEWAVRREGGGAGRATLRGSQHGGLPYLPRAQGHFQLLPMAVAFRLAVAAMMVGTAALCQLTTWLSPSSWVLSQQGG